MERTQNRNVWHAVAMGMLLGSALGITAAERPEVPFPDAYASWRPVKTASEEGKIYHFYANPQAVEGYRAGKFPNGAILVRETLKEGERTGLDVMLKDDRLYTESGGWGFETFDSRKGRLAEDARTRCYTCHSKQKEHDLVFTTLAFAADAGTPYPEGYRHWTFLHASLVPATFDAFKKKPCEKPCMAGIFYFYANDKAMAGLRTGTYADGAIIAEEMLEWLSTSTGAKEGQRRVVGVMVKDSKRYSSTDGWGYGSFDEDGRTDKLEAKQREACHTCHVSRKDQGYVFTEYRER
jgi:hypothetical protein